MAHLNMSEPGHFKIACTNCQGHIEFPQELHGQTIDCPHCGLSTILRVPGYVQPSPVPPPIAKTSQSHDDYVNLSSPMGLPDLTDESLRSIQVKSSKGTDFYTVNLIDYTCTCPSFLEVHSKAMPRDFGRICKHICASMNRPKVLPLLDPMCRAIVREGYGIYPGRFERDNNGNIIYITGVNSTGWANVFALKRINGKTYYRFGFNVNEGRWAYGLGPKINEEVLFPKPSSKFSRPTSSGMGWRIFWGISKGVWTILRAAINLAGIIILAIVAVIFTAGTKSRRKR